MKKQYIQPGVKVHHLKTETVLASGTNTFQSYNYDVDPNGTKIKGTLNLFNRIENGTPTWTPNVLTGDLTNGDDYDPD